MEGKTNWRLKLPGEQFETIEQGAVRIRAVAPKIPAAQKCTENR